MVEPLRRRTAAATVRGERRVTRTSAIERQVRHVMAVEKDPRVWKAALMELEVVVIAEMRRRGPRCHSTWSPLEKEAVEMLGFDCFDEPEPVFMEDYCGPHAEIKEDPRVKARRVLTEIKLDELEELIREQQEEEETDGS